MIARRIATDPEIHVSEKPLVGDAALVCSRVRRTLLRPVTRRGAFGPACVPVLLLGAGLRPRLRTCSVTRRGPTAPPASLLRSSPQQPFPSHTVGRGTHTW